MNVAIIQARMGSSRLPGKVLMPLDGKPMLKYQIERVIRAQTIDKLVVATTTLEQDDVIFNFCRSENIECYRGSVDDVLSRYHEAAVKFQAKNIIRLTADCPFSDPNLIDRVVNKFLSEKYDYLANTVPPQTSCYPDGSDVEIFTMCALNKAYHHAVNPADREHVTFYFWKYQQAKNFNIGQFTRSVNDSRYRITVDYPEDYDLAKRLAQLISKAKVFGDLDFILQALKVNPDLSLISNKGVSTGGDLKNLHGQAGGKRKRKVNKTKNASSKQT